MIASILWEAIVLPCLFLDEHARLASVCKRFSAALQHRYKQCSTIVLPRLDQVCKSYLTRKQTEKRGLVSAQHNGCHGMGSVCCCKHQYFIPMIKTEAHTFSYLKKCECWPSLTSKTTECMCNPSTYIWIVPHRHTLVTILDIVRNKLLPRINAYKSTSDRRKCRALVVHWMMEKGWDRFFCVPLVKKVAKRKRTTMKQSRNGSVSTQKKRQFVQTTSYNPVDWKDDRREKV